MPTSVHLKNFAIDDTHAALYTYFGGRPSKVPSLLALAASP